MDFVDGEIVLRDHPRVRGEKAITAIGVDPQTGSPPRARGKGCNRRRCDRAFGITPACAGKSASPLRSLGGAWDHPRVRGEKHSTHFSPIQPKGSPPRARGKDDNDINLSSWIGITPACAGKSTIAALTALAGWDHPRVRGEK